MRRITGTFVMLAAFSSGCTQQSRVAQDDGSPAYFRGQMTPGGSSWARNDVPQFQTEPSPDVPSLRNGAIGFVAAQQPQSAATQTAAKPSMPVGYASTGAPQPVQSLPVIAEVANPPATVTPAAFSVPVDPALKGMPAVSTLELTQPAPTPPPQPQPPPMPIVEAQPLQPLPPSQPVPPQILLEPRQPVSVAIDSKSSPAGAPALRLVNTKHFTLSYSVQDGGAGVAAIDLWETRDSKNWKKCDNAQPQQNAYLVEVKDEGVFGYTMVARPLGDKGNTQPKAGDVPQVWVTVDTTKPVVSLTGVELNLASKSPNLIVRWSAKDKNFGPRPITLSYAEHADGPWLPLAANIENTGRHESSIPANMPKRAFIRIEAVDLVGNSGMTQTDKSVRLDFSAPLAAAITLPPPPPNPPAVVEQPRPVVIIYDVEPNGIKKE